MATTTVGYGKTVTSFAAFTAAASDGDIAEGYAATASGSWVYLEGLTDGGKALTFRSSVVGKRITLIASGLTGSIAPTVAGVVVTDFEVLCNGSTIGVYCTNSSGTVTINNVVIIGAGQAGVRMNGAGNVTCNKVFVDGINSAGGTGRGFITQNGGTMTCTNCEAWNCPQYGFWALSGAIACTNCLGFNNAGGDFSAGCTGSNNASGDATVNTVGIGTVYNLTMAQCGFFEDNITNGNYLTGTFAGKNVLTGVSSYLAGAGTATAQTTDIDGYTFANPPSIGCYEVKANPWAAADPSSASSQSLSSQSLSSYSTQTSASLSSLSSQSLSSISTQSLSSASSPTSGVESESSLSSRSLSSASSLSSLSLSSYSSASSATSGAGQVYPAEADVLIIAGPYGPNGNDYLGTFNHVPPAAPTITAHTVGSGQITITIDGDAGVTNECWYRTPGGTWTQGLSRSGDGNIVQTGLTNGTTYEIQARSKNASGIYGPASDSLFVVINSTAEIAGSAISAFMAGIRDQYLNSANFLAWIQGVDATAVDATANVILGFSPKDMPDVTTKGPMALVRWANLSAPNSGSSKAFRGTIDIIVDHVYAIGTHARASHTGINDANYISKIISEIVQDVGIELDATHQGTITNISSGEAWQEDPADARIWHREITYQVAWGVRDDGV